jgi:hypothetical protein
MAKDFAELLASTATTFSSYSWDQGKLFVSIYISYPGCKSLDSNAIHSEFGPRHFALVVDGGEGASPRWKKLHIRGLCKTIDPEKSIIKIKANREMIVVKLRKAKGVNEASWSDLTDTLDRKEAARQQRLATELKDADTATLLADMYKHASDEDRRGLMEAAVKGRAKREGGAA